MMTEPILSDERLCYFPIQHDNLHKLYQKQIDCFWRAEEIDLSNDSTEYDKLNTDEQHFINHILGFFASSDSIVMGNLMENFMGEVKLLEAKMFYSFQSAMESIHSLTYSLLIDTIVKDKKTKDKLFNSINEYPAVKKKADWSIKYFSRKRSFGSRLVAFACVEGIFFSGAFASIFWLKKRGVGMNGLIFSNELISRDEALHTEFAIALFHKLLHKPTNDKIKAIIKDAIELEKEFIIESLPCRLIGMNSKLMNQYIEFVGDRLCTQLCNEKIYNTCNPFDFMEAISLEKKTNFFESRVSEYALATKTKSNNDFDFKSLDF